MQKQKPQKSSDYIFGKTFTDHMLTIDWNRDAGWQKPQIVPYGPIKMPITATSLHYGISCHEGLNLVKNSETGKNQAFRAQQHMD